MMEALLQAAQGVIAEQTTIVLNKPTVMPTKREETKAKKVFMDTFDYIFTAPLIEHPGWPMADRIKDDHLLYRLAEAKCFEKEHCTEFEAMGYLSSMSMISPMNSDFVEIYYYLFKKYLPDQAAAMDFDIKEELDLWKKQQLNDLRGWIYKKQMQVVKSRRKAAKKEPAAEPQKPQIAQFTMEDY